MAKYLDPRADLTFKRVFGEHPHLVISLLNSLLPLPKGVEIKSVEYLPAELVPQTPTLKDTIVDVRCKDQIGRQFIVEMQMYWYAEFFKRVVYNSSKVFVKQAPKGFDYSKLQNVYSLNIINDIAFPDYPNEHIQEYCFANVNHNDELRDEFYMVFVELPKFRPSNKADKKLQDLWLKYLTEINEDTRYPDAELLANPEINEAIELLEEAAYTPAQLAGYEQYWDAVSKYTTAHNAALRKGEAKGRKEGLAEGRKEGLAEGEAKGRAEERAKAQAEKLDMARKMKSDNMPLDIIEKYTGLTADEIAEL